jgi:hypothetical protein
MYDRVPVSLFFGPQWANRFIPSFIGAAQYNFCGGAKFVTVCINVSKPKPA